MIIFSAAWARAGEAATLQGTPPAPRTQAEVKAYYLINIARFVEWPSAAFPNSDSPLLMGILGRDSLGSALQAYAGQTIKGHPIQILRSRDIRALLGCQILFVSESEEDDLIHLLRTLRIKPILTFGETEGFQNYGGMVRLYEAQGRVKFLLNRRATDSAQLKVSSRLLAITTVVEP